MGLFSFLRNKKTFKGQKYFVITIDVENDKKNSGQWENCIPYSFKNITDGIPQILQPLFTRYGARPTYLLNPSVLMNEQSAIMMHSFNNCELGTHLHPEFFNSQNETEEFAAKPGISPIMLNYDEGFSAISQLTNLFKNKFGYLPKVYRAGRYGFNGEYVTHLLKLGYEVDTSVFPQHWESEGNRFVNNYQLWNDSFPVFIYDEETKKELLEIPITVNQKGTPLRIRPDRTLDKIIKIFNESEAASASSDIPVHIANLMFHSNDVYLEGSPYCRSIEEQHIVLEQLNGILLYAQKNNYEFVTLSELRTRLLQHKEKIPCKVWIEAAGISPFEEMLPKIIAKYDLHSFFLRVKAKAKIVPLDIVKKNIKERDIKVLECGSGMLAFIYLLGNEGFKNFTALDYDETVCTAAREIASVLPFSVDIKVGNGQKISSEILGFYQMIIHLNWTYLLEGLDYTDLLKRSKEMLQPPGYVLIDTIDYPYSWMWEDRKLPESERRPNQYVTTISSKDFSELAKSTGFRVLDSKLFGKFKTVFLLQAKK